MTEMQSNAAAREIVATRLIQAPRDIVWEVSTRPEHIRQWWVCSTMTMPVCDVDLRVGGAYRYVGRMADGTEVPMKGIYQEVEAPGKVVCTQIYDVEPFSAIEALVTVTLTEKDGGTMLQSRIAFPTDESYQGASASGMEAGMGIAIDRLAELSESMTLVPR